MASPSVAITRTELGLVFSEFTLAASRRGFIGPSVLRPLPVAEASADVASISLENLLREQRTARAPRAGYNRSNYQFGKLSYSTSEHGAEEPVDDAEQRLYASLFDCELVHRERAIDVVLRGYESEVAAAVFNAVTWAGLTTAATTAWDVAASMPLADVAAAKRLIADRIGAPANALIMNQHVYDALRAVTEVLDRIIYGGGPGQPAAVTKAILAQLFDLEFILVASGVTNTADEGQAATLSQIWSDDYAMVARVGATNDPIETCIGRTFLWTGDGTATWGEDQLGVIVEEYREENVRSSVLRARHWRGLKIVNAEAGQLLSGVLTPP